MFNLLRINPSPLPHAVLFQHMRYLMLVTGLVRLIGCDSYLFDYTASLKTNNFLFFYWHKRKQETTLNYQIQSDFLKNAVI
jgi:hypothetical protein